MSKVEPLRMAYLKREQSLYSDMLPIELLKARRALTPYIASFPSHIISCQDSTWVWWPSSTFLVIPRQQFQVLNKPMIPFLRQAPFNCLRVTLVRHTLSFGSERVESGHKTTGLMAGFLEAMWTHICMQHSPRKTSSEPTTSPHPLKHTTINRNCVQQTWKWQLTVSMRVSRGWSHV